MKKLLDIITIIKLTKIAGVIATKNNEKAYSHQIKLKVEA